ncbi:MAG: hypothetical protein K8W52_42475, partial [Deltaproteobacteria bacterium]|nr:hypothetical protein [Deltaproteobacteria bacterium]
MPHLALLVSASRTDVEQLGAALAGWAEVLAIDHLGDLTLALARNPRVVVIGVRVRDGEASAVRAALANREDAPPIVVISDQPRHDDPHAFQVVRRGIPTGALRAVLA